MALENANEIQELVPTNPESGDPVAEGDNHLRMIKTCLQTSLPGMTGPWATTSPINCADPVANQDVVTLAFLNAMPFRAGVGWPMLWFLPALPDADHIDLEGQILSRANYAALFALYGTTYGAGDGTTTFQLPDCRGLFLRVWDHAKGIDPDAATRTNRGDGVTGDNVGTKESFAMENHTHLSGSDDGSGGQVNRSTSAPLGAAARHGVATGQVSSGSFSTETRPVNINVRLIIRAK